MVRLVHVLFQKESVHRQTPRRLPGIRTVLVFSVEESGTLYKTKNRQYQANVSFGRSPWAPD